MLWAPFETSEHTRKKQHMGVRTELHNVNAKKKHKRKSKRSRETRKSMSGDDGTIRHQRQAERAIKADKWGGGV